MATNGSRKAGPRCEPAAVAALAAGATAKDAAAAAGISERTIHRRLDDPAFLAVVGRARATLFAAALGALAREAAASVDLLAAVRDDSDAPPNVRRQAARDILTVGDQLRATTDLAERLAAVEIALGIAPGGMQCNTSPD